MCRVYAMIGDVLDRALNWRQQVATALLVQAHKSLLQMAIDQGSLDNAGLVWPEPDSLTPEEFGGSELEMRRVHQYRKAIEKIKTKLRAIGEADAEDAVQSSDATRPEMKLGGCGRGGKSKTDGNFDA